MVCEGLLPDELVPQGLGNFRQPSEQEEQDVTTSGFYHPFDRIGSLRNVPPEVYVRLLG